MVARPRGLHSRDTLVGMLWPEMDQAAGRHALRNVLHAIRQALGPHAIRSAGDGMVGVNFDQIECDAIELERELSAGNADAALAQYHGELLQGFHVADAPEFERWLESERRHIAETLVARAWSVADSQHRAGDIDSAVQIARRIAAIAPNDEIALRRFISFLDKVGDRFGAIRAYEEFADRFKKEYDAEPSAETQQLVRTLREKKPVVKRSPVQSVSEGATPEPVVVSQGVAGVPGSAGVRVPETVRATKRNKTPQRAWLLFGVAVTVSLAVAATAYRESQRTIVHAAPARLVVLPMENQTGDRRLDYVGAGLADGIATRLEGIGGISVRSGARSDWPASTRHDFKEIGRQFGSVILLKTTLGRIGDSLEVRASVLDLASSQERAIPSRRFTTNGLRDMESELAASVAGAVFRVPLPAVPRQSARPVDPESYRLMLVGWHQLLTLHKGNAAKESFIEATRIDPTNARAWSGLSSAWATVGGIFGEKLDEVEAAAERALALDSLQGSALADLGFARALRYRNLADGMVWMRKAIAAEPSNPEIFLVLSSLYRHAWMWDEAIDATRIAQKLDPLSSYYVDREAGVRLCTERPALALPLYQREVSSDPSDTAALKGVVRSLSRLGRYDDAIAEWRVEAEIAKDTMLIRALALARGKNGFLSVRHLDGSRRIAALQSRGNGQKPTDVAIMQAQFAAGDVDGGYAAIERLISRRSVVLYRLLCMPDLDEVRGTPRFEALLKRTGPLPQR